MSTLQIVPTVVGTEVPAEGLSADVQLGAGYYIPTFVVPALVRMLLRRRS
jgi:hypothetical protein